MRQGKMIHWKKVFIAALVTALILPQTQAWADTEAQGTPASGTAVAAAGTNDTNISLGKPYTISQGTTDPELMDYETRTDGDNGSVKSELTDGKIATTKSHDSYCNCDVFFLDKNWVGFNRQISRSVVIDLGSEKFIGSVIGGFLQERTAGVELPRYIHFSVSHDKSVWYRAGVQKPVISTSQEASRQEIGLDNINVTARYVKVEFEVGMFSFTDEITVNGRDPAAGDADASTLPEETPPADVPQPTPEERGGVNHMFLATYYPPATSNGPLGVWKKDDFKPYVAHIGQDGNRTDWMFDTIIFANGGDVYRDYGTKDKWLEYLNNLFTPGQHIDALNQATAEAGAALGDPNHKTKVVVSIPYPAPEATGVWGELNGEQLTFNRSNGDDASFDARKKAVAWYVGEVVKRFQQQTYSNVEFAGFYWTHEEVGFGTTHEEDLIKAVSGVIHQNNKHLYWIPFFQANGSTIWKELGFDAIMLQPNYYFKSFYAPNEQSGAVDPVRLLNTVATAKRFGMGVEMEGDYQMAWNGWATDWDGQLYNNQYAIRKYYAYMNEYKKAGLDQGVVGYYWGARTVMQEVVDSSRADVRETYDETAKFTNGTYATRVIDTSTIPLPAGDTWDKPIELEAYDGYSYTQYVSISASKWYKFPIKAGEDWVVTLTPLNGASVGMESRLWAPSQTPHSGFSYNKSTQEQSLIVSNPGTSDGAAMLRVFPDGDNGGGKFRITLHKPVEDGTSMMNAIRLPNSGQLDGTAASAGQEIWYKINGKKAYQLALVPQNASTDMDLELYWDANSGEPQAVSSRPAGQSEVINYNNGFADSFVYYVKVKAKTAGGFTLYNGILPPGGLPKSPGVSWDTALQLDAKEGELFRWTVSGSGDGDWYKFPIKAGEDWVVNVTALNGGKVSLETRYFTTDAFHPHGGFSYSNEWVTKPEHNLIVSNRDQTDSWIYVRVSGAGPGGDYKLSLRKPVEDGTSKMNALPLRNDFAVVGHSQAGQVTWYKIAGSKSYNMELKPYGSADMDLELFWGSDYDNVLASSHNGAGQTELMGYSNPYDAKFVYYVKVTAKTAGSYKLGTSPGLPVNDHTPPAGTIAVNGGAAYTNQPAVTLTLAASDNASGVYQMQFSSDAQTWSDWEDFAASKSFVLTGDDGTKPVYVRYSDYAGNVSDAISTSIVLDTTPPAIQFQGNNGAYTVDQTIHISCTAVDALSGIASSTCRDVNGEAYAIGLGRHDVAADAVDGAGNAGHGTASFTVSATFDSLNNLTKRFTADAGIAASLEAKLMNAKEANNANAQNGKINAYINEVQAQRGKSIAADQADTLIALASALLQH